MKLILENSYVHYFNIKVRKINSYQMDTRNIGLRNIEVADTKICSIDGENGKLIYRGYDIFDLVNHSTFEETSYLLLFGDLPDKDNLREFSEHLSGARDLPRSIIDNMKNEQNQPDPWMW